MSPQYGDDYASDLDGGRLRCWWGDREKGRRERGKGAGGGRVQVGRRVGGAREKEGWSEAENRLPGGTDPRRARRAGMACAPSAAHPGSLGPGPRSTLGLRLRPPSWSLPSPTLWAALVSPSLSSSAVCRLLCSVDFHSSRHYHVCCPDETATAPRSNDACTSTFPR